MSESETRSCPYCKEEIKAEAIKCKHCHSSVKPNHPSHEGICPYCKEEIKAEAIKCKHCKSLIGTNANVVNECDCSDSQQPTVPNITYLAAQRGNNVGYGQDCYYNCYDGHIGHGDTDLGSIHRHCEQQCQISMPSPRIMQFPHNNVAYVYRLR